MVEHQDTADVEKAKELKQEHAKKSVSKKLSKSPMRLWESLVLASGIEVETKWADLSKTHLQNLANQLTKELFKSTEKYFQRRICNRWRNRFKEINFKTMESKP
jgi:predicted flavoprotein YhiN